jgi:2'-5' RNA ligase
VGSVTQHYSPLKLELEGIGFFPNPAKPRVIWIGVSGDVTQLVRMQGEIEQKLKNSGFAVEDRRFQAHATIGRVKREGPDIQKLVQTIEKQKATGLKTVLRSLDHLVLFKSLLTPQGPHYEILQTFHLSQKP